MRELQEERQTDSTYMFPFGRIGRGFGKIGRAGEGDEENERLSKRGERKQQERKTRRKERERITCADIN
jgi:hypothetical protein